MTARAIRRGPEASERFPEDVVELQGLLGDESPLPGVRAIPGQGTHVPLYILGSSLFGAQLAAMLGLPYAFASHFAPQALDDAIAIYREQFTPSAQLERPYLIAGVGVIAAETAEAAAEQLELTRRARAKNLFSRGDRRLSDEEAEALLRSPQGAAVDEMLTYTGVGTAERGRRLPRRLPGEDRRRRADHRPLRRLGGRAGALGRAARRGDGPGRQELLGGVGLRRSPTPAGSGRSSRRRSARG